MVTRKHMLSWLYRAERQQVPMTNYGVAISLLQGVLPRALQCFPAALHGLRARLRRRPEDGRERGAHVTPLADLLRQETFSDADIVRLLGL